MRRLFTLLFTFFVYLTIQAQVPAGYYDAATGTGYTLKTQLHNIIDGQTQLTYDGLWTYFQTTDVDSYYENDGTVMDMYSENPDGVDPYNYTYTSGQCGSVSYSDEGDCYNREHSFPKSWFDDGYPMYADLFHLYPTDGKVNGYRSNYPYGEVASPSYTSQNGSKLGPCSYSGYTGTVFEPIDEFKGDLARSYFYMATRYEDVISSWPGSDMLDGSSDKVFTDWALNMLMEWNANDPVSQKEIDRNDAVYGIQGNRNPFIDHPEYVNEIWGGGTIDPEPTNQATGFSAVAGGSTQIDLSWTDATLGTQAPDGYLIKISTINSFTEPVDGTDPASDTDLSDGSGLVKASNGIGSYTLTSLSAETTYYFKMWSYTNSSINIDFKVDGTVPTANATTDAAGTSGAIAIQDFDGTTPTWSYTGDGSVDAAYGKTNNGYRIGGSNSITLNSFDITGYSSVKVYVSDASTGGVENADALEIFVNVDGAGFPTTPDVKIQESDPTDGTYNVSWDYTATNIASTTAGTPITVNGDDAAGYANVEISIPDGSSTVELKIASNNNNSDEYYYIDDIKIEGESAGSPTLNVSSSSLTGFTYQLDNGPSSAQSFEISGEYLDGTQVTVSAPTGFEVSSDGVNFTDSEPVSYTAPTLSATTISVRMKAALVVGSYNGSIVCSDNGSATDKQVTLAGEVFASNDPEPDNHLTNFIATAVSTSQIDLSWTDATGTNLPSGYLIKANTTGIFTDPVDGTDPTVDADLSDGVALIKVAFGNESYSFGDLNSETTYYFKAWSYANSGTDINFKTDGTTPTANVETGVGINQDNDLIQKIFPNPANTEINIVAEGNNLIELFDVQGKRVAVKEIMNNGTISVVGLNAGVYFIRVQNVKQTEISKLIIR